MMGPHLGSHNISLLLHLVEVYNCATGSTDCSQCLGREDLGHRCTWTESSSSCRLNTESLQTSNTCPAPEIQKVRLEHTPRSNRPVNSAVHVA